MGLLKNNFKIKKKLTAVPESFTTMLSLAMTVDSQVRVNIRVARWP